MARTINKTIYVAITIVAVAIATGIGFFAGQVSAPAAPAVKETLTITQRITQTLTITTAPQTIQTQQTPRQPTQEELLAPIIEAAKKEGKLVIYTTFDRPSAQPLLDAFKAKYPFINIEYVELSPTVLYQRYTTERAAGVPTADILWLTNPDLVYLLILNGSAQPYRLTIYDKIPEAAKYKDLAYVPSYTCFCLMYNAEKIPKDLAPKSYADLLNLLTQRKDLFPPKSVLVGDPEQGPAHLITFYYLYKADPELIQRLYLAAGSIGVVVEVSGARHISILRAGQALVSLSVQLSYASREAVNDTRIGVFVPSDIAVLLPRPFFITKEARNPNAAKLFLEFAMSEEGQDKLARSAEIMIGDNKYFPQLSLGYFQANVKKLLIVKFGDPWLDELLKPDIRSNVLAMWKKWLGIG